MRTFRDVESWVRDWRVPPDAQGMPVAAAITLRLDGVVVGRGQETAGPKALATAVTQAIADATARLPIERDALYDENLRAAAARMAISLEFAGPFVPINPESWEGAALELAFGLDGVAARLGERTATMFPGAMLTASGGGMDPGRALAACLSKASDDPTLILQKPGEIAKDHGAVYYRFRTIHLAQRSPNTAPDFLHRGGRVVDTREITEAELQRWADALADQLQRSGKPAQRPTPLHGTYNPLTGQPEATGGGNKEQFVAALALHRYSRTPGVLPAKGASALACSDALWELTLHVLGEEPPPDPSTAALALLRPVSEIFRQPREEEPLGAGRGLTKAGAVVIQAFAPERGFAESVPPAAQGLVALAIASEPLLLSPTDEEPNVLSDARGRQKATAAARAAFNNTPPGQLVNQMPWLGWTELLLSPPGAEIPSAVALREMRRLVWEHQLRAESLSFDQRDLAGGIVFTAARNPLPSWQCARPLAFIATMLGDPRLTDDKEVPGELARLLASLRFLRQLTADDAEGWMYADPTRARGGVRISLWDQRMPIEATAMTLMTICETLRSMDVIRNRRAAAPPAP